MALAMPDEDFFEVVILSKGGFPRVFPARETRAKDLGFEWKKNQDPSRLKPLGMTRGGLVRHS